MMKCGLLGRTLGHSYSPQIHQKLGSYSYELFEKEPDALEDFLKNGDFTGLNVTVPYKEAVIPYLDALSPLAQKLGAVNTVVRREGKLIGHNSDFYGFQMMLHASGLNLREKKALILGSGGASKTVCAVLSQMQCHVVVISRRGENNYTNLHLHRDAALIVNTTPVGMYPDNDGCPIDLDGFPSLEGVLDIIYNPARTRLLIAAQQKGLFAMNGLLMLVAQAKESAEWFLQRNISDAVIPDILLQLQRQMENIILIGMPGCGKSTIAGLLAKQTGKICCDSDDEIIRLAQKTIPELFAHDGEDCFRVWETKAISQLGKQSGAVIATGGGCVIKAENYVPLHQNGRIFWIQRDLDRLSKEGRPLSQANSMEYLYAVRKPLYEAFADCKIDNNGDISSAVEQILRLWEDIG